MGKLTKEAVGSVCLDCLFERDELIEGQPPEGRAIIVEGISRTFGFDRERVEQNKPRIKELLDELPEQFHAAGGGGWTFLNACVDKDGHQWGEHRDMEALFVIGTAAGYVTLCMERDMWPALPGGMPYYAVDTRDQPAADQPSADQPAADQPAADQPATKAKDNLP